MAHLDKDLAWSELQLGKPWHDVVALLAGHSSPRLVQARAIEAGLLTKRRNLIVSAPTNAGKSLVGTLALLDAVRQGKRAVLLEPLRALAQEKFEELDSFAPQLGELLGRDFQVRIATGDYRLEDEFLSDPPPGGELLIATPERLEALLRRADNLPWFESLGCVVVDEAHMIREARRGPTLEFLLTSLKMLPAPPRLVLLSATLGDTKDALAWLEPCDLVMVTKRHPPLTQSVLVLKDGTDVDTAVQEWCRNVLSKPDTQVLIFVYQTKSANKVAREFADGLAGLAGTDGAQAYHSQMARAQREAVRQAFMTGRSRVVVTTTALAMGINLPTTHVLVRDNNFPGAGRLEVDQLRQMLGRAGRGERAGVGTVLVRPNDPWNAEELAQALKDAPLPPLASAIASSNDNAIPVTAKLIAALLARRGAMTQVALETFLLNSLGKALASRVASALMWLERRKLAFEVDDAHVLTTLGKHAVQAVVPLELAAGYAQLIRDLLEVDEDDEILSSWRKLDHLLVLELLRERPVGVRQYSKASVNQVDTWMERFSSDVPVLYRNWIRKGETERILGSLGIEITESGKKAQAWANKQGYLALFRAIVIFSRTEGMPQDKASKEFGLSNLEGLEERWRDDTLWLLSGISTLLETKVFYYHLREVCGSDEARIKRVEGVLRDMKRQIYALLIDVKYFSPLGSVLRQMRRLTLRSGPKIGAVTIQHLEDAGITDKASLLKLSEDELVGLGIKRNLAKQIRAFAHLTKSA